MTLLYKLLRPLTAGLFFCAVISAQVQIKVAPANPLVNTLVGVDPQPGVSFLQIPGGIGGSLVSTTNYYAVGWNLPAAATNVTISAFISPGASVTAYLTTQIGAGTSISNQLAVATITGISGGSNQTTPIFTGLNLPAGNYYLTLAGSVANNAPSVPEWFNIPAAPGSYITNSAGGTTGLFQGVSGINGFPIAQYPPASSFFNQSGEQQTGSPTWSALLFDVVSVQTAALPAATAGTPYSAFLSAGGGVGPYTWSGVVPPNGGPLPAWLTLNSSTGLLSGTPPANGSVTLTVTATDSQSNHGQQTVSFPINIAGKVLTANLPAGMAIVNMNGQQDLANHANASLTWRQPFSNAGQLVEYTLPAGTYTFRVIDPADALAIFPALTQAETSAMWAAWTYNIPWITGWLAFDSSAVVNTSETQLFSGADAGPGDGSPAAAYADAITNGYENSLYPLIRTATPQKTWFFPNTTTLIFALPDDVGQDNGGGVSVLIAPTAAQALNITTSSLNNGQVGVAYGPVNLAATGGGGNYSWTAAGLPPGLSVTGAGVLSGTPTHIGAYNVTLTVEDPVSGFTFTQSTPLAMTIAPPSPALSITTNSLPAGEVGAAYSAPVAAAGGFGAYRWGISAGAPLSINAATGALSSSGPLAGSNLPQFTVTVTDAAGDSISQNFTVTVNPAPSISTVSVPSATLDESYGFQLAASNGTGPYSWAISAGALPSGLTLTSNGIISGKPNVPFSFNFTAQVTDSLNVTASQPLSITVTPPFGYAVANRSDSLVTVTGDSGTVAVLSATGGGYDVAQDASGNFIVAAVTSLLRVTPSGATTTIATPVSGHFIAVTVDQSGNIIAADNSNHQLWRISPDGLTKTVIAQYIAQPANSAEDVKVVVDAAGNYIVAHDNTRPAHIVKVTPAGVVTEVTLSGQALPTIVGGLALDGSGNYMVLDATQNVIFQITPAGAVSTFAINIGGLFQVLGLVRNPLTGEYIVGGTNNELWRVSADGRTVTALASDPNLSYPEGVAAVPNDYPAGVAATNPLGYFRMETQSGTSEVNGYAFTMTGGSSVGTPGAPIGSPANNFVALDGNTGMVTTTLTGGITTAGSIAAWVNLAALPSTRPSFSYIAGESQVGNDFDLQFDNSSNNVLRFYTTNNGLNISYTPDATTLVDQWHFVVATFDATASTRALYWDGALVNSDTVTSFPNKTTAFQVGSASPTFPGRNFFGGIDEVGVWNYALSPAQVYRMFITRGAASGSSISSLAPSSAAVNSGPTNLTINGTGFAPGATVRWTSPSGQTTILAPASISAAQITVTVPVNLLTTGGTAEIAVGNAAGVPGNQLPFSVTYPAISITPPSIPNATVGTLYRQILTASGGSGNFSWTILPPEPEGLNLTIAGGEGDIAILSGTPTSAFTDGVAITVQATDTTTGLSATQPYSFNVNPAPPPVLQPSGTTAWLLKEDGGLVAVTGGNATQIVSGSSCTPANAILGCLDIARDAAGNFIIAAGDSLRRYTPAGASAGANIPAPAGSFYRSVTVDGAGNYVVADDELHQVVRIAATGGAPVVVYTYHPSDPMYFEDAYVRVDASGNYILAEDYPANGAPLSLFRISPDGSQHTAIPIQPATANGPVPTTVGGMTFDARGNYIIVDYGGQPEGVYTISPAGVTTPLFIDTNTVLRDAEGISRDPISGNYFLVDDFNDALYTFGADGSNFSTLLSGGLLGGNFGPGSVVLVNNVPPGSVDYVLESNAAIVPVGGSASAVSCNPNVCAGSAFDFAADAAGNFIVASGGVLAKVTPAGVSTAISLTSLNAHWVSVAVDAAGNYIVADNGTHQLVKFTPAGSGSTIAGYPVSVASSREDAFVRIDAAGNYILAHDNSGAVRIFRITPAGAVTELTLTGTTPTTIGGLTFDASGNYVVTDRNAASVYVITTAGVSSVLVPGPAFETPLGIFRDAATGRFLQVDNEAGGLFSISADGTQIVPIANGLNAPVAVLSISTSPLTITTTALPAGTQGQTYNSGPLTATGGSGSYQWSATGLPAGLSMSLAGVISGTAGANAPASSSVVVTVTDANNASLTATKTFQLSIGSAAPPPPPAPPPLTISSSTGSIQTKPGGQASASFTASGGLAPYSFSASGLPAGVTFASGTLSGSPSQAGTFNVSVTVNDAQHASAQTSVVIYVLGLTATSLPGGTAGQTYSATVGAVGGSAGYSFSAAGVPPGLSFSTSGALTGTPSAAGTYNITVTVASAGVISVSGTFSVTIARPLPLGVTSTSLPDGTINTPYSQPLAAHGGLPPYAWTIIAGSLPAGLSMNSSGIVSGTPTAPGTVSFGAQATDTAGATATGTVTLAIHPAPLAITTQSLPAGMATVDYPVQLLAATGGVSPYTWSAGSGTSLPGGMTFSGSGALSGVPAAPGSYALGATVTDAAGTKVSASLVLTIRPQSTDLILTAGSLQFSLNAPASSAPGGQTVGVQSTVASQPVSYTYAVNPAVPWLGVSGGSTTPDTLQVSITPAALSLVAGDYQTTITATCASSSCTGHKQTVAVDLAVANAPPKLAIGTTLLSFATTTSASGSLGQSINIQNTGGGTIGFASVSCEAPWCTTGTPPANLTGGTSATIAVTVDPSAVTPGFYRTQADIVSSAGRGAVPVTLFVAPSSTMTLAPAGQQFNMSAGSSPGNPNGSFLVSVNTATAASWTAAVLPGAPWLRLGTAIDSSTSSQPGTVSFSIDPAVAASLAPGAYYGLIEIASPDLSNSPQDFEAILHVVPASTPLVPDPEPGGLLFITSAGGTLPPQTVSVYSGSTSPLTFQTSAATTDGGNWLAVTPDTGSSAAGAPGVTTVNINTSGLKAGVYHGGISYSLSATAVRTVNATLIVTSAPASAAAVSGTFTPKAAGCVASKLAPAQTGLVNNFSQPAAWPTPLVIQLSDDCGAAVTNGQIVATFSNGDPPLALPLVDPGKGVYSGTWSPRQTGSQISINVRASAPGLADAISQISGAVTPNAAPVLTPHGTLHSFDPLVGGALAPGTIVQIYGENLASQTAQPSAIPLPPVLNGTSVIIGGLEAPLYFVSAGQVNAQIPFELEPGKQYQVILSANGALTTPDTIQLSTATPGLAAFADGTLIAQHGDGTLVTKDSPAKANEYLVAYGAGMGGTNATPVSGAASPLSPLAEPDDPPTLMINGTPSPLLFAGLTPGLVGLYQINFQVPASLAAGNITIAVTQDGLSSNQTVLPYLP